MSDLSKADKRTCRGLIHIALERECKAYADKMAKIASKPVVPETEYREENGFSVEGPWHKRYIEYYQATDKFDRRLQLRYDGISGARYLPTVMILHEEGWLTDEEVARVKALNNPIPE